MGDLPSAMQHRRQVVRLLGCGCASLLGCSPLRAQQAKVAVAPSFFLCETLQITDVPVQVQEYSASGDMGVSVGQGLNRRNPVIVDEYTTRQLNLRWRPKHVKLMRDGRPVVRINFVDGSSWQQGEVRTHSEEWRRHSIGVDFDFVGPGDPAEIRISFGGRTNKSATGIEALSKGAGQATMFLPDVRQDRDVETRRRVVLHEFGHGVMTFGHEHRHADAVFQFVGDEIIRNSINEMLGSNDWTVAMVRSNITNPPYSRERTCTAYEPNSIMHYPIRPEWLVSGTAVPVSATTLSTRDIDCAKLVYPG